MTIEEQRKNIDNCVLIALDKMYAKHGGHTPYKTVFTLQDFIPGLIHPKHVAYSIKRLSKAGKVIIQDNGLSDIRVLRPEWGMDFPKCTKTNN